MTPNALLHAAFFGNSTGGIHLGSLGKFLGFESQNTFDPKSLQESTERYWLEPKSTSRREPESRSFEIGLIQRVPLLGTRHSNVVENLAQPVDGLLNDSVRQIIGENGVTRLREFARYEQGWDLGRGKPLAPRSVVVLNAFLTQLPQLAAYSPSLFMTHEGNLELGSEDSEGRSISIEFYPERLDYYLEGLAEERMIRVDLIPQLVEKVRSLIS
jgi:hypothetical protein